jgi:hypothetical protein
MDHAARNLLTMPARPWTECERRVCVSCLCPVQLCTSAPSSGLWLRTKEGFDEALISSLCQALQRDLQHTGEPCEVITSHG